VDNGPEMMAVINYEDQFSFARRKVWGASTMEKMWGAVKWLLFFTNVWQNIMMFTNSSKIYNWPDKYDSLLGYIPE